MFLNIKLTLGLAGIFLLLFGCRSPVNEPGPATKVWAKPTSLSLPALSELAGTPAPQIPPPPDLSPEEIALGRNVYALNCSECHGRDLEGEVDWQQQNEDGSFRAPAHNASGHTWHHGDRILLESIALGGARLPDNIDGTSNMPAFANKLTEAEMLAVLTYIKSSWPVDIRAIQWEKSIRQ